MDIEPDPEKLTPQTWIHLFGDPWIHLFGDLTGFPLGSTAYAECRAVLHTQSAKIPPQTKKFFNYLLIRQEYAFIHDYFLMMMMFVENRKKKIREIDF